MAGANVEVLDGDEVRVTATFDEASIGPASSALLLSGSFGAEARHYLDVLSMLQQIGVMS